MKKEKLVILLNWLIGNISDEEEDWIKEHRIENALWKKYFLFKKDFATNGFFDNRKNAMIMIRDILDAKAKRKKENSFVKNPHLAQLSNIVGLKVNGKKINQKELENEIINKISK